MLKKHWCFQALLVPLKGFSSVASRGKESEKHRFEEHRLNLWGGGEVWGLGERMENVFGGLRVWGSLSGCPPPPRVFL